MYKMFFKDAWSQTPAQIKNLNSSGWTWQLIYFGLIIPTQFLTGYSWHVNLIAYYYSFLASMLVSLFLVKVWPNKISKTLLLCPLPAMERKKYVYAGFKIRIWFSIFFFLVCNFPLYIMEKWKLWHLGIEFVFFLLYVITVNIYVPPINSCKNGYERKYNLPGYYNIWEILVEVNGLVGMMYLTDKFRFENEILSLGEWVGIGIFFAVGFIIMIVMLVVYLKPVMEQAMGCENPWREKKKR